MSAVEATMPCSLAVVAAGLAIALLTHSAAWVIAAEATVSLALAHRVLRLAAVDEIERELLAALGKITLKS